jgi:alkaline phosphatase
MRIRKMKMPRASRVLILVLVTLVLWLPASPSMSSPLPVPSTTTAITVTPLQHITAPVAAPITSTIVPRNLLLFIGDGMGLAQVRAAGMYRYGQAGTLLMENLPYTATMTIYSADNAVTDSAAAGTAMATGHKVDNGVISQAIPGDGRDLETLTEFFHAHGKSVGLVSTAFATHATSAAFAAHAAHRSHYDEIAQDYLTETRPEVLMGGGANGLSPANAAAAGYTVVTNREEMAALDPQTDYVSGQFGDTHMPYEYDYLTGSSGGYDTWPHLDEMVSQTLTLLEDDPDGFFLMVEGARIDHAGHLNDLGRNICETLAFDAALRVAYAWAADREDTLIIVTADHETGGLQVLENNGPGNFPTVQWTTTGHTATEVPVYAWGVNAGLARLVTDNIDIYGLARSGMADAPALPLPSVRVIDFRARSGLGWGWWGFAW